MERSLIPLKKFSMGSLLPMRKPSPFDWDGASWRFVEPTLPDTTVSETFS